MHIMKKNSNYLIGFLFFISMILMGCNEEVPNYTVLVINTNSLSIDKDTEGEVQIINGNGNYIVTVGNENIASADIKGNIITVKGLTRGTTTVTIKDWAKSTQIVNVKVNEIVDLKLTATSLDTEVFMGEPKSLTIYSGNPEYTLAIADPTVVKAEMVKDNIFLTPLTTGNTMITLTDAADKSLEIPVKVVHKLMLDTETADIDISLEKTTEINILSGNGGYEVSGKALEYCDAEIQDNKITITGTQVNKKNMDRFDLIITDAKGQKFTLKVFPDYPFLETSTPRARQLFLLGFGAGNDYSLFEGDKIKSTAQYNSQFDMTYMTIEAIGAYFGYYNAGWIIKYEGNLTKGKKKNAHRAASMGGNSVGGDQEVDVENFEIMKVDNKTKTYWIVYYDPLLQQNIYLVAKAS